jgi:F-type H+-transporting ATPase subunit delta
MIVRGPSAEAASVLSDQLATAVAEVGTRKTAQVGDDLFALAGILRATPSLRRVLTDVSIEGDAKSALAREVFADKVDAVSLDLLATAVARRWTATRDLADTLEHLSEVAIVQSAGDNVGRVGDELFTVAQAINGSPELRDALSDPGRSIEDKTTLVETLLGAKALAATVSLVKQSLSGSYRTVGAALTAYEQVAASVQEQRVATVRVAQPLSETDLARLGTALSRQYGRQVHLNVIVEPEVIGGIRVEIGDDVIDGSVASRLADAQRKLAG